MKTNSLPCAAARTAALFVACLLVLVIPSRATTYFVSPTGSDAKSGDNALAPFKTLQIAANHTKPGDTVNVMSGTFAAPDSYTAVLMINTPGKADAPITYQAAPGQHPVIQITPHNWSGICIEPAPHSQTPVSYIVVSGFELIGNNANISGTSQYGEKTTSANCSTAIVVGDGAGKGNLNADHITIQNCSCHDCGGGGIGTGYSDYITIKNNVCYNNAFYSPYGASGISIWEMRSVPGDTNTGYRNFITGNICHDNAELVGVVSDGGKITDGNGIIVDRTNGNAGSYPGRTLVTNNVVYNNGGSGIHAFHSSHVDLVNNTADNDNAYVKNGEIFSNNCSDVKIINNVMYARKGSYVNSNWNNAKDVVSDYNTMFNGGECPPALPLGAHDTMTADPKFVNVAAGSFRLSMGSPAIGSGTIISRVTPAIDIEGANRPQVGAIDRGAYQYAPGAANAPH